MTGPTFAGTTLPDAFVGVPYLAGLPVSAYAASGAITAVSIVSAFPQGLTVNAAGLVSGTVQVTSSVGSQLDGAFTAAVKVSDSASAGTASTTLVINVHYLTADQDLTAAAQASIRDGVLAADENTQLEVGGVVTTADYPSSPTLPTDIG
jgi:hypothetical protein